MARRLKEKITLNMYLKMVHILTILPRESLPVVNVATVV
nr:MAG TPA: hypothetical protein [Caudoviricetes sp.]